MFYIRKLSTLHRRSFARKNNFSSLYHVTINQSIVCPLHNTCVHFYVTHCLRTEIRACVSERPRALICNCFKCAKVLDIQKRDTSGWDLRLRGRDVRVPVDSRGLLHPSHSARLHFRLFPSCSLLIAGECSAYKWNVILARTWY